MRNFWLRRNWKLKIKRIDPLTTAETFVPRDIEISYGPQKTQISSCAVHDLRDACGISAHVEMATLIAHELECYPGGKFRQADGRYGPMSVWNSRPKAIKLSKDEKDRLVGLFYLLRQKKDISHLLDD